MIRPDFFPALQHMKVTPVAELQVFAPPYNRLIDCEPTPSLVNSGSASYAGWVLVWHLRDADAQRSQFDWLISRPPYIPLAVVLPHADEIHRVVSLLQVLELARPKIVLPSYLLATPARLRYLVVQPPPNLAQAVCSYLRARPIDLPGKAFSDLSRLFEAAPGSRTVTALARQMYVSRRTLGRQFRSMGLPQPCRCLQFARLLHVAIKLQMDAAPISRIAVQAGYPDGFTMSNQMKRLVGERPSSVRVKLGWEWLLELWLKREGLVSG